ncbi:2-octaprenyl-6-methoxyphenyl hydroxylase [Porticoccus sp. W117]|uniref:2-octaprenyl-6-methoxyphenyl hydroxylase n=1 Tax=Porticoccus sp. W117 TaxID=3054777 RepID=UPI0025979E0B|nr:2-octaprenyl-6-methoxyphenyl hydroxylase [Porticoccus sp. W117]MDM3872311.1 2-octaprenyl-6-methoxyphenyl hydroxylase [Porticoccus sp. W117]
MNQPTQQVDIAIAGAGMVGATLALLLRQANPNWRILVVEPHPQQTSDDYNPSFDDRSTALSWRTREVFEGLGLWQQLEQRAAAIEQIQVSDRGHIASTQLSACEQGMTAYGYVVENRWLGQILQQQLANSDITLAAPATIEQVTMTANGAELSISNSNTPITCELLIVADGARSTTRDLLGIGVDVQDYGQMGLIANIALAQPHNGVAYERFTANGPMALLPLPDSSEGQHRSALVWTLPPDQAKHLSDCDEAEFLAQLQQVFGYRQGNLLGVGERHLYPLKLMETCEQVRRHLVVVGNAAHSLHPVAGQGFNLAIRDIAALVEVLAEGTNNGCDLGDLALLQKYQNSRESDQQRTVAASHWLPKFFAVDNPTAALARGAGLFAMDMVPSLRGQFARYGMGVE